MSETLEVLIVDDNEDDVFLVQEAFRKAKLPHRLQVARDGVEGVACLQNSDPGHPYPDLVLLDLNMPKMNGFEVLKWIRNSSPCKRLMVHVLTASARNADVEMAYAFHANSFTVKPTRLNDLVEFVGALSHWHRFVSLTEKPEAEQKTTPPMAASKLRTAEAAHF